VRKNKDKPKLGKILYMPNAITHLAKAITFGEEKYTPAKEKGWMKYNSEEVLDSMMRHATAMQNGEVYDPESGLLHSGQMLFNAAIFVELTSTPLLDSLAGTSPIDSNES
jgi:hypothetical protein